MSMEKIAGHSSVKKMLNDIISSGKIGHAYIFEGLSGVGRLTTALCFASEIAVCRKNLLPENNPDIIIVSNEVFDPDSKAKALTVETSRNMKKDVYIKPFMSERKIYIIPNADTMTTEAQNSILKVFEEPPEYCSIILISENENLLLQTIRSRATTVKFRPLPFETVKEYLIKEKSLDEKTADIYAVMSGGSIGKALLLMDDNDAASIREELIKLLIMFPSGGHKNLYDFIKFLKLNKSDFDLIVDILSKWSSDALHIKLYGDADVINKDKVSELKEFSKHITRKAAFNFLDIITKYSLIIRKNANYPIAVTCMATEYWEEINGRNYRSSI